MRLTISALSLCCCVLVAHAGVEEAAEAATGQGGGFLSSIDAAGAMAKLQAMYDNMVKQLKELKAQSESLSTVRDTIRFANRQVKAFENRDLDQVIDMVKHDIDGLTGLDDTDGMTTQDKLILLADELDQRLADPTLTDEEQQQLSGNKQLLSDIKRLTAAQAAANELVEYSNRAIDPKESTTLAAQAAALNASIMAELARLEKQKHLSQQLDAQAADAVVGHDETRAMYDAISKREQGR